MLFQGICGYGADSSQSSLVQQLLLVTENLEQVNLSLNPFNPNSMLRRFQGLR